MNGRDQVIANAPSAKAEHDEAAGQNESWIGIAEWNLGLIAEPFATGVDERKASSL